jgi:multisubunit Na+/H+ antiporter MnhG subunit
MSRGWQLAIGGIVIAIILFVFNIPLWVPIAVLLIALAVPVVGYMMLDSNQKTRIRRMRQRKQIGR